MSTTRVGAACAAPRRLSAGAVRPPNRLAQQITGRTYLSHSQISLMRSCPRHFAFLYVEKAAPDFIPNSLILGGSLHAALELHYRCKLEGLGVTYEALLSAYHDAWRRQIEQARQQTGQRVPVQYSKNLPDADAVHELGARMLTAFLASPLANPKGIILGIEEELRVVLDPDLPDLLAKVDLVTQTDGSLHVIDFKTSRTKWTEKKAAEAADQLVLYAATVEKMSRSLGLPVKLHFAVLTKHKTPQVQLLPVAANMERVAVLREGVAQIWQAIQSGNFYPSPSPMNCATCPFRSRCPVFAPRKCELQ